MKTLLTGTGQKRVWQLSSRDGVELSLGGGMLRRSDLPGVAHHEVKVGVSIDRSADARVVVDKLFDCHLSVRVVGAVEVLEEEQEDLVLGELPVLVLGVLAGVVHPL